MAASGRDGLRDTINLHRFVLLKNSITQAESPSPSPSSSQSSFIVAEHDHDEVLVFPEASALAASYDGQDGSSSTPDSEEKWLESVLEDLDDDFDGEVEVEVHPVEEDDDFPDTASDDLFEPWSHSYDSLSVDPPLSISQDHFVSSPSAVLSPPFPQSPSLQLLFDSPDSPFNQLFVEPRYPEADFDLPISEASSDSDSDDDDDGPLTPYGGSQPSLDEQTAPEPEVYVEQDSYFLYPSELDPISPQPLYYQQC